METFSFQVNFRFEKNYPYEQASVTEQKININQFKVNLIWSGKRKEIESSHIPTLYFDFPREPNAETMQGLSSSRSSFITHIGPLPRGVCILRYPCLWRTKKKATLNDHWSIYRDSCPQDEETKPEVILEIYKVHSSVASALLRLALIVPLRWCSFLSCSLFLGQIGFRSVMDFVLLFCFLFCDWFSILDVIWCGFIVFLLRFVVSCWSVTASVSCSFILSIEFSWLLI